MDPETRRLPVFHLTVGNDSHWFHGREALEVYGEQHEDIDVVVLDLTMPHMDGEECYRRLRRVKGDVRVIMSSGYTEQEIVQRFAGTGIRGFAPPSSARATR